MWPSFEELTQSDPLFAAKAHAGTPAYKSPEEYYDDILDLKKVGGVCLVQIYMMFTQVIEVGLFGAFQFTNTQKQIEMFYCKITVQKRTNMS